MSIKLVLLKSGEEVIAETKEMVVDEKDPQIIGYLLHKPCLVKIRTDEEVTESTVPKSFKVGMYPFIALSKDKTIPIPADWVVTMVEPIDNVLKMYQEDVLAYGQPEENSQDNISNGSEDCDQ